MKSWILCAIGAVGGVVSAAFGGWSEGLTTLVIFMAIDYLTGIIVAAVFHKSKKSETGRLESNVGLMGLCKKCAVLFMVLVAVRLDLLMGTAFIQDAVVIGFICNDGISIMENVGLMGIEYPEPIRKAFEALHKKIGK